MATPNKYVLALPLACILCLSVAPTRAQSPNDWPMWRCNAYRSGAAPLNELPDQLTLQWSRQLSPRTQAWDDPLNLDLMTYDRVFEPIVMGGRLFMSFNDRDKVSAFDAKTGAELWSAYADGPVRLPPAGWKNRVYFCSDDGFLYCVNAESGELHWRFRGAPNAQKAIGNQRLVSAWPARGGVVIRDDTVYFAASIWPFMGTFIYAIDAQSGDVKWVNDNSGSQYIKQPHSAPSFAGVAPQGALVATNEFLVVPGGRSVPATFNRTDGKLKYFEINAGGKGTGGSFVSADENQFYVHTRLKGTRAFNLKSGVKTAFMPNEPVLHNGMVYSAEVDKDSPVVRAYDVDGKQIWQIAADGSGDLILAGKQIVAAGKSSISIIDLPNDSSSVKVAKTIPAPDGIERLIAAAGKIFAVSLDGQILAFGDGQTTDSAVTPTELSHLTPDNETKETVRSLLDVGDAEGYAIWYGDSESPLAQIIQAESPFHELAFVDPNIDSVNRVRQRLDQAGIYGHVSVRHDTLASFKPPKNVAHMVFVDAGLLNENINDVAHAYEAVRPYGGVLHVLADKNRAQLATAIEALRLEQATVEVGRHGVIVRREGALPGSADWTHQYGDIGNTIKSNDSRVKLPLGILWFGGSSNMDVLPRHGHGPPEQVIGGRLFIEGMNSLSARDVYTGRVLWKREFKNLGTFDVYYDSTFSDEPLDPKYNQVHIPGANGRGTNFVATEDRIYLVEADVCHVLDPATGESYPDIKLPGNNGDSNFTEHWGYVGVYKDVLIGGIGFADYQRRKNFVIESDKNLKASRAGFGGKSFDRAASVKLAGFDRYTGKLLWQIDAAHSFWHNGIVAGGDRIYCLDRNPTAVEAFLKRRGVDKPNTYRIVAIDFRTGEKKWQKTGKDVFGTWLGYSEDHNLLLQAGAAASDRLAGEVASGMAVYHAADGTVNWQKPTLKYTGPCILHNDLIITNTNSYAESAGAFYLKDGSQKVVPNPLTGELQPWKLTRAYGCNNIIASENLLTFRSGAAGYYDLNSNSGTGNLGGFKSGCTSNLVVANGVLNAPDYTRTCSCAYQNQTSLALVHMPDVETWSVNSAASVGSTDDHIEALSVNLGAAGDRRDADDRLWIEYPVAAGPSPPVSIQYNDDALEYQHHSSTIEAKSMPWVLSSGLRNIKNLTIGMKLRPRESGYRISVSSAGDDAEENEKGEVDLSSSDLELVEESSNQLVGIRFNNVRLDRDSEVRNAYIQFTCDEKTDDKTSLNISAQAHGNAPTFTDAARNISTRPRTSQSIAWKPTAWKKTGAKGKEHRTPDLTPLIKEVIRRDDWKSGNSIAFFISGSGKRVASAWKNGKKNEAQLVLDADTTVKKSAPAAPESYRVRLFFGLPHPLAVVENSMDVFIQEELALSDVTLKRDVTGSSFAIHQIDNVMITDELKLRFVPQRGEAVLSGIQIIKN